MTNEIIMVMNLELKPMSLCIVLREQANASGFP